MRLMKDNCGEGAFREAYQEVSNSGTAGIMNITRKIRDTFVPEVELWRIILDNLENQTQTGL